ncbi:Tubulin/FtsZ family, GTPase domain-containing protein [Paraphysoderma sedebokerense]|nr:Tubulin/FtsZ family, GTPase domain-containing protein [Paraphysoderma sedebokerense]
MAQSIVIQVGQCGNQIGNRFWDMVLSEHAKYNQKGLYDESMATFFRNVDTRYNPPVNMPIDDGKQKIRGLKARGLIVDMEEGVINEFSRTSHLNELFDDRQKITDKSGSGNNWAVGYHHYGPQHREQLVDMVRKESEYCDSLQSVFITHSMGGGTGSGLGSYLTEMLCDEFPEVYRFSTVVFPSKDDDVVTSPYNSVLALSKLSSYSDCILPIENQALIDICTRIASKPSTNSTLTTNFSNLNLGARDKRKAGTGINEAFHIDGDVKLKKGKEKPFDEMNNVVGNLMLNLTSSMRFEGSLNVDINEITMNLVPFPKLKYLLSSITPLYGLVDVGMGDRSLDQMFIDAFSRDSQLLKSDPKNSLYLACALIVRGDVEVSDVRRNIERMKSNLNFIWWNQDGWKTGICKVPPVNQPRTLLTLSNNCCIKTTFNELKSRFMKLYSRKANLHHYTKYTTTAEFSTALNELEELISEYEIMDSNGGKQKGVGENQREKAEWEHLIGGLTREW